MNRVLVAIGVSLLAVSSGFLVAWFTMPMLGYWCIGLALGVGVIEGVVLRLFGIRDFLWGT